MPCPARSTSRSRLRRLAALTAATALTASFFAPAAEATPRARLVSVRVISFNDLHGNLEPPSSSSGRVVLDDGTTVDAGGAAYLATHIKQLQGEVSNSFVVSTGDSIGASPLASALFHDEPTIEFLDSVGVKASVVGNHEFDEGYDELKRMQQGGCHPTDGCQFSPTFAGAKFPFLGANVTLTNGTPALLPFKVQMSGSVPIGIIGVTLQDLPSVVTASAIKGLKFGDEVKAIDRTANLLDRFGVRAQIVLLHQGDSSSGGPNACNVSSGVADRIAREASPKVDAFFTGHSHQQYNCSVTDPDGHARPVIQGLSFGRLLSVMDFKIDRRTREIDRSRTVAHNEIVNRDVTPDPAVSALVNRAVTKAAPIANRPIGTISADLTRSAAPSGETALGDVIADAQLAATTSAGAQIAITNPGGVRADLNYASSMAGEGDGVVTYGEAFTVQPFANIMQTITLTGAQLDEALEQQSQTGGQERILQISDTLHYSWDRTAAQGDKASDLTVNGVAVSPTATYRVSVNNFLSGGGDNFAAFTKGTDLTGGPIDLDAFTAYLSANGVISPPALDRITLVT